MAFCNLCRAVQRAVLIMSQDAALAALAVALYAADGPEERLLGYLQSARDALGRPLYDTHTALRVCRSHNRLRVSFKYHCLWLQGQLCMLPRTR
jgi:hypothetical protein